MYEVRLWKRGSKKGKEEDREGGKKGANERVGQEGSK